MKKTGRFISGLFGLIAVTLILTTCKADGPAFLKNVHRADYNAGATASSPKKNQVYQDYSFISPEDFFTLDYRPEFPEEALPPGKVNLNNFAPADDVTTSAIPPLQDLSKYRIKYQTKRMSLSEYLDFLKAQKQAEKNNDSTLENPSAKKSEDSSKKESGGKKDSSEKTSIFSSNKKESKKELKPFYVSGWGPSESVPGELSNPQFYVEFSNPLMALQSAPDQAEIDKECRKIFTITPEIEGSYSYLGTKTVSFLSKSTLNPAVEYTITVNENLKDIDGQTITGERVFVTKTAAIRIDSVYFGVKSGSHDFEYTGSTISPRKVNNFWIKFNYYLDEDYVSKNFIVKQGGELKSLKVKMDKDSRYTNTDQDGVKKSRAFYVQILDELGEDSSFSMEVSDLAKEKTNRKNFYIGKRFSLRSSEEYSNQGYGYSVYFYFTEDIDESTILDAVTVNGKKINSNQYYCYDNRLRIQYLNAKPEEILHVDVSTRLKSVYGDNLPEKISFTITGRHYRGFINYLDYGSKIMEAQFPHKLLFEYMNVSEDSAFRITSEDKPVLSSTPSFSRTDADAIRFDSYAMDVHNFQVIDLDPYLKNGRGAVNFNVDADYLYYSWDGDESYSSNDNSLQVQVTDLAATVRYGINRAVVMLRTMSDNKPVKGAEVYLTNREFSYQYKTLYTQTVLTDENGLAVIPFDDEARNYFEHGSKYAYDAEENVVVVIKTKDDQLFFVPRTHNNWESGVARSSISSAYSVSNRVFMFSDRGLYKPGETVTFRGIDRDKQMGCYTPYHGSYTVTLEGNSYRDDTVYGEASGKTSDAGGFYGSFVIPEDAEPGSYVVTYKRNGSSSYKASTPITVAYFEPLKIQSELKMEEGLAFAGDVIDASVASSYLAGGYLAGALYEADWYCEPTSFRPSSKNYSKYYFSNDIYDYKRLLSSDYGALDDEGKAYLSCTADPAVNGIPYIYRLEVGVTDVSNQKITSTGTKVVHPAFFYVGVAKPLEARGFMKTGVNYNYPVVALTPDEKLLTDSSKMRGKVEYSISCQYWTYNYRNSVDGSVWESYTEHNDEKARGSIDLINGEGKINFTPENSGYHTLTVWAYDSEGRKTSVEYNFYVSGSGSSYWGGGNGASLKLTPSQSVYNPGDTAEILLESPLPSGDYLITVEREGIFTEEVKHFDQACSVIEIPIARNYTPVVYVSVSSYSVRHGKPTHEYGERDMDKPKSYYGVTPVFINPRVKAFTVKMETDKIIYHPGETATVTLTALKGGKPVEGAELTAMAADRAVLDLINYHVPDPISYFYDSNSFPLRVSGGDSRDYLMDPVTYSIKNLQGGDSSEKGEDDIRNDFRATAFFEPELITDKNGKVSFTFKVPSNLSTFRMTAFGVKGDLLALQEDEFVVQNVINVQAVQPRRLRVRDTAQCGVLVTNLDTVGHDITVSMEIRNPAENDPDDEEMGITSNIGKAVLDDVGTKTIHVASGASSVVYFNVAAEEKGNVEFVYTTKCAALSEKMVSKVKIEKTYFTETVSMTGQTEYSEKSASQKEQIIIPSFAEDGVGNISFTLDATHLGALSTSVNYLFEYPHGCMEQQSSRVLPLVIFEDYIDVFDMNSEVNNVRKCVKHFFKDWVKQQNSDGGFPYWPDRGQKSDEYVSLRIALIYGLAMQRDYKSRDFPININALKNYIYYSVKQLSNSDYYYYDDLKAMACYVFALLGDSRMDDILRSMTREDVRDLETRAYLGLAWSYHSGEDAKTNAYKCAEQIKAYMRPTLRSVDITHPYRNYYSWYYNYTGELATMLELLVRVNPTDQMADRLIYRLLNERSYSGYWHSTISTAKVLEAMWTVIKQRNLDATDFTASIDLMNKEIMSAKFKGVDAKPVSKTEELSGNVLKNLPRDETLDLNFKVKGKGTLYYTTSMTYALPDEIQNERNQGFKVKTKVYDIDTEEEVKPEKNGLIMKLKSGRTYVMEVTYETDKSYSYAALRVPVPSGAEILNSTFVTSGSDANPTAKLNSNNGEYEYWYDWYDYYSNKVIYDNEVDYFWNYVPQSTTVRFSFRAAHNGIYPVTPVKIDCMYEPEVFGNTNGYIYIIN